ncbi:MAG: DUF3618 domain-containing protein [Actinomycetaceae bacterium]|nr:DUF3618 domain-containing protein [Actinomycetaceae bacterium]
MSDRTPAEIEKELQAKRAEFEATVDQIASQLDPRVKIEEVKTKVTDRARALQSSAQIHSEEAKIHLQYFFERAQNGDLRNRGILTGIAAGAVGLVGLAIWAGRRH